MLSVLKTVEVCLLKELHYLSEVRVQRNIVLQVFNLINNHSIICLI